MRAVEQLKSFFGFRSSFSSTDRPDPRDEDGMYLINFFNKITPQFNDYSGESQKIKVALSNPALLKVICLQCDLFSLGKVYVYKDDVEVKDDPFLSMIKHPNHFQRTSQWLWDLMFYEMMGTAHCYTDSDVVTDKNKLVFLNPAKMEFPRYLIDSQDKIVLSDAKYKSIMDSTITYKYDDGTTFSFPFSRLTSACDLSNGTGNWFKSNSRIDALGKVIDNSEKALDATNINLFMAQKFVVGGVNDPKDTTKIGMSEEEKKDIESKVKGRKQVHAVKNQFDLKRFVDDMRSLELGKAYAEAYYIIGSMYGIPKDVLEAYLDKGATFENQEKSAGRHITNCLQPKGNDFFESLANRFKYTEQGKTIVMSWDHLPLWQVFEKDRATVENLKVTSLTNLLKLSVSLDEANEYLDLNFKSAKYEQPKPAAKPNAGANQGNKGEGEDKN